jgi:predicted permease
MAPYQGWSGVVTLPGQAAQDVQGARVGAQFLDVLQEHPLLGRGFTLGDERYGAPPVVVLSYTLWSDQLRSDPNVIGKTLLLDGRPFRVIGVLPKEFFFPNFTRVIPEHPGILLVAQHSPGLHPGNNGMGMIARLKGGVTPAQAKADLDRINAGLALKYKSSYVQSGHLEQLNVIPLREDLFGPSRVLLLPIFGAVFIVLLIACLNVANLLIARTLGRQRDLAMRLAIGATGRHVIGQIAAESFALAAAGTVLGVIGAHYVLQAYVALNPPGIHRADQIGIDARVVLYAAAIAAISALVTATLPAVMSLGSGAFASLKDSRSQAGGHGNVARASLVVVQIACAFALVAACGLLLRSLQAYSGANLGYRTSSLLTIGGPPIAIGFYPSLGAQEAYLHRVRDGLAAVPGVDGVAYGTAVPLLGGGSDGEFSMTGAPKDADADFEFVSPQYFHVLGIPVLRGRDISASDNASSRRVALVDQQFVKSFVHGADALGKHFNYDGVDFTIVGIVPPVMLHYVGEQPYPSMYFAFEQLPAIWKIDLSSFFVPFAVHTSVPTASVKIPLLAAWRNADPREPVPTLATVAQLVERSTADTRANVFVLGVLALIALLLSISGTASVAAYAVARRTNEIGVRMALGARPSRIVRTLLVSATTMLVVGLLAGLGLAALAANSLAPQLYQTALYDPATYIGVALMLATATLLASFIPAYRAATIDPSTALRYE